MGYNNETDGVFDFKKESAIVGDLVVDALMYPNLVSEENSDKASGIATEKVLMFRRGLNIPDSEIDAKAESENLAKGLL